MNTKYIVNVHKSEMLFRKEKRHSLLPLIYMPLVCVREKEIRVIAVDVSREICNVDVNVDPSMQKSGLQLMMQFSEPFDTASWMLVVIVAIHAATLMILLFEWASPSGFDMKVNPSGAAHKLVSFISLFINYVCFPSRLHLYLSAHGY